MIKHMGCKPMCVDSKALGRAKFSKQSTWKGPYQLQKPHFELDSQNRLQQRPSVPLKALQELHQPTFGPFGPQGVPGPCGDLRPSGFTCIQSAGLYRPADQPKLKHNLFFPKHFGSIRSGFCFIFS